MEISNKKFCVLKYELNDSISHWEKHETKIIVDTMNRASAEVIKPSIRITNDFFKYKDQKKSNCIIIFFAQFYSKELATEIINFKGVFSFDFIPENKEKDHSNMSELFNDGYEKMKSFIFENALHYSSIIAFNQYHYTFDSDFLTRLGFYAPKA